MVQEMDEGAKEGAIIVMMMMDQGAIEEAMSVQDMDQGAIEGAMDGASGGSGSNRRSDGWCERLFRE